MLVTRENVVDRPAAGESERHWTVVRRWPIVLFAALAVLLSLPLSLGLGDRLVDGGYLDPAAESSRAERLLSGRFGAVPAKLRLTARSTQSVREGAARDAGRDLVRHVAAVPGVLSVASPWTVPQQQVDALVSREGRSALLEVGIRGDDEQAGRTASRVIERYTGDLGPLRVEASGRLAVNRYAEERSQRDLITSETIGIPLVAIALVLIFGSFTACLLPLAIGLVSISGALAVLSLLAGQLQVSVFAPNIVTALGFGLAVDYSLIMVSRFREEVTRGAGTAEAVASTVRTAGRTVVVSAAVVGLSLSALLFFPAPFFRSLGAASMAVVALAGVGALVLLPALLALLGNRLGTKGGVLRWRSPVREQRSWEWLGGQVLRRPVAVATVVSVVLLALAVPLAGARSGFIDESWLARQAPPRAAAERAAEDFPALQGSTVTVLFPSLGPGTAAATGLGERLSEFDSVTAVLGPYPTSTAGEQTTGAGQAEISSRGPVNNDAPSNVPGNADAHAQAETPERKDAPGHAAAPHRVAAGSERAPQTGVWYTVTTSASPYSGPARDLVAAVRTMSAPGPVMVAGETAALVDMRRSLALHLGWAAVLITLAVGVLLFLYTGSVLVPAKAIVMNLLTLAATMGAMVVLFQDGELSARLGGSATGHLDPMIPVVVFCVAFGVSMDYEVFLVARIREEYLTSGDNGAAVVEGLRRTGPLMTAAALTLIIVMGALVSSSLTVLQLLGTALALAVAIDATLVRCLLVPAVMGLAGRWNWWAPAPLLRVRAVLLPRGRAGR
ncbi:MMPL family transporter [Streptomyces altiplanensis]